VRFCYQSYRPRDPSLELCAALVYRCPLIQCPPTKTNPHRPHPVHLVL